jgi:hypothetical protein
MPYQIEALGKAHDRVEFDCGSVAPNRHLHQQARQDAETSVACAAQEFNSPITDIATQ